MTDICILCWNLKSDLHCELSVLGTYTQSGNEALQSLAGILFNSGICEMIQIRNLNGTLLEDWTKGYKRTETAIFNETVKEIINSKS